MKITRKLIKLIKKNESQLLVLASVYILLVFLSKLPYFSVLLTTTTIYIILFIIAMYLFRLKQWHFSFLALLALAAAVTTSVFHLPGLAEELGNLIYVLMSLWLVFGLIDFFKSLKKNEKK